MPVKNVEVFAVVEASGRRVGSAVVDLGTKLNFCMVRSAALLAGLTPISGAGGRN